MMFSTNALHQLDKLETKAIDCQEYKNKGRAQITVQLDLESCTTDEGTTVVVQNVLPIIHEARDGKITLMRLCMIGDNPSQYPRRIATPGDVEAF